MTDLELVTELLGIYERVYSKVVGCRAFHEAVKHLDITATSGGICMCARKQFGEHIDRRPWVKDRMTFPFSYWGDGYAVLSDKKMVMLSRIQTRIEILREIKKEMNDSGAVL